MASVTVKVDVSMKSIEEAINSAEGTLSAINSESSKIAAKANSLATEKSGKWYETGKPHTPGRSGGKFHDHGNVKSIIGDKSAKYASKPAKRGPSGVVGIVFTANYAAQKDNTKHNTLLKAKG